MSDHKHKCGFVSDYARLVHSGQQSGGCGEVFSHGAECYDSDQAHLCPKCGQGPWFSQYRAEEHASTT